MKLNESNNLILLLKKCLRKIVPRISMHNGYSSLFNNLPVVRIEDTSKNHNLLLTNKKVDDQALYRDDRVLIRNYSKILPVGLNMKKYFARWLSGLLTLVQKDIP